MRKLTGLLGLALLTSPAFAQIRVIQDDGTTDFTSRGIAGNVPGWAFNAYKYDRQGGGIDDAGLNGWSTTMQDQNCTTLETFQFAILEGGVGADGGVAGAGTPLTNGDKEQWPDPAKQVFSATAQFLSPTGGANTACAWIYTTTFVSPVDCATLGSLGDLFTATYLQSNLAWTGDGASSHISIDAPLVNGAGREYPNQSVNIQAEAATEFGVNWVGGSLGATITPGTQLTPGSKRYWRNNLRYQRTTRAGVIDTTGVYTSAHGATAPKNMGMAGSYVDVENSSGVGGPGRLDEIYWQDNQGDDFGLGTATGTVLLGLDSQSLRNAFLTDSLRFLTGGNAQLVGTGCLEINPNSPLFTFGGTPGLGLSVTVTGAEPAGQEYVAVVPLAQSNGARSSLGLWFATNPGDPLILMSQVARVDFATNQIKLASLDSHSFSN
jgi:hypothetical protein